LFEELADEIQPRLSVLVDLIPAYEGLEFEQKKMVTRIGHHSQLNLSLKD